MIFSTGDAVIYSRLVAGRFPDYRMLTGKMKINATATIPVDLLTENLKQIAATMDESIGKVEFNFAEIPSAGNQIKLTLGTQGAGQGKGCMEMSCDYSGTPMKINFNPKYVLDVLKAQATQKGKGKGKGTITLNMTDGKSPAWLQADNSTARTLLMPLS